MTTLAPLSPGGLVLRCGFILGDRHARAARPPQPTSSFRKGSHGRPTCCRPSRTSRILLTVQTWRFRFASPRDHRLSANRLLTRVFEKMLLR